MRARIAPAIHESKDEDDPKPHESQATLDADSHRDASGDLGSDVPDQADATSVDASPASSSSTICLVTHDFAMQVSAWRFAG